MTFLAHQATPALIENAWLVPAFPLASALILLGFGRRMGRASGPFATFMMVITSILSFSILAELMGRSADNRTFVEHVWTWFSGEGFTVDMGFRIDELAVVMLCVVTGVGALIHLYSVGYMRGDPREPRYFAYLSLFATAMLILVMSDNLIGLFLGWEGVGVCSYLLIGFWFTERPNAAAAKKAFLVNRVGDAAFLIAIFFLINKLGSVSFSVITESAPALLTGGVALTVSLLLMAGAAGKSAQIPLHVWLPDAMAGPTPVSALIHAATMVTAGIYLLVRMMPVFEIAPDVALTTVAWIGTVTLLLAGIMAIVQDDIKKVLAYSTISQLGFMFAAIGVGASSAAIFHLVTHAFFKALLFLGAGSVMHATGGVTDLKRMGGLFRRIPWTAVTFTFGWLAIIGFPFTSGFYSKDQMLEAAYTSGNNTLWILGLVGAVLTGFYMTRLWSLIFLGRRRDESIHPHESPPSMIFPLIVLGVASLFAGLVLNTSAEGSFTHWMEPITGIHKGSVHELSVTALSSIATAAGLLGAIAGLIAYGFGKFAWIERRENPNPLWRAARERFYIDSVYEFLFTGVGKVGATSLAYVVDAKLIDGAVAGVGEVAQRSASIARKLQNGYVRTYALSILVGTVAIAAYLVGRSW